GSSRRLPIRRSGAGRADPASRRVPSVPELSLPLIDLSDPVMPIEVPVRTEVLVRLELVHGDDADVHATFRHLGAGGPGDRVENDPALHGMSPVPVPVCTGEAEAAAAVLALGRPGQDLRF